MTVFECRSVTDEVPSAEGGTRFGDSSGRYGSGGWPSSSDSYRPGAN